MQRRNNSGLSIRGFFPKDFLMSKVRTYSIFLLAFFICACIPQVSNYKEPLKDEGEVFIYLQPMPQEAHKYRFSIERISAIRANGSNIPLTLSMSELKGAELAGSQKLLASGVMPPGQYRKISILVKEAYVRGEEGEAALLIPEKPVWVEHIFSITQKKATTLFLAFNPLKSVTDKFSFTPVFSPVTYERELTNLTGYVTISDLNIISVFNKKTMMIIGTISTGRTPKGIVLDQISGRAYVAVSGDDAVEVIDLFSERIIGRIILNPGDEPNELSLTPDRRTLVTANYGSNTASIIDTSALFEVSRISVGQGPTSATIDSRGLRAYIMNSLSNTISVVDLSHKSLFATISVGTSPFRGAFNLDGDKLYVISRNSPDLLVINPSSLIITERIFIGTGAISIKVDTQTNLIMAGKKASRDVSVIDPFSLMFIDSIALGGTPVFMTIDNSENTLLVVLPDMETLKKINLVNKKIIAGIEVGDSAYSTVVMGER